MAVAAAVVCVRSAPSNRARRGATVHQLRTGSGFRPGLPNWITEIWAELRKVTWPTRDETAYLTMVVIVVAVIVGVALA